MRTVAIVLSGTEWHMPVNFAASLELAERIRLPDGSPGDPLTLSMRGGTTGTWPLNGVTTIRLLAIGVKHAGCNWPEPKICETIMADLGLPKAITIAGEYIGDFCKAVDSDAGSDPGGKQ